MHTSFRVTGVLPDLVVSVVRDGNALIQVDMSRRWRDQRSVATVARRCAVRGSPCGLRKQSVLFGWQGDPFKSDTATAQEALDRSTVDWLIDRARHFMRIDDSNSGLHDSRPRRRCCLMFRQRKNGAQCLDGVGFTAEFDSPQRGLAFGFGGAEARGGEIRSARGNRHVGFASSGR